MGHKPSRETSASKADAICAVIAGHHMIFSETRQKVYEFNNTAADIWRSIRDGCQPEDVVDDMVEHGLDRVTADSYVRSMLAEWSRRGIRPSSAIPTRGDARLCQEVRLAGLQISIRYWTDQAHLCARIFQTLESKAARPDLLLDVVDRGPEHQILRDGFVIDTCTADEIAPVLKARLMTEILETGAHELALHAASLVRNERLLLIAGAPGAGKTTLTLALDHAGFGFAGDDLALLDSSGRITGVPFAAAVKSGAWPLVAGFRPDVYWLPVFRRPDRKRVRYVTPITPISVRPCHVGWIVLLRRRNGNRRAKLRRLNMAEALQGILKGAHARHHRLTKAGFAALVSAVEDAHFYDLSFSRLEDATALLEKACR